MIRDDLKKKTLHLFKTFKVRDKMTTLYIYSTYFRKCFSYYRSRYINRYNSIAQYTNTMAYCRGRRHDVLLETSNINMYILWYFESSKTIFRLFKTFFHNFIVTCIP